MRLSELQKFILTKCFEGKGFIVERKIFAAYYNNSDKYIKCLPTKIITRSLENLISKNLMIGFGQKTAMKWFIVKVKLTNKGIELTKKIISEQLKLPLKK